jgi:hypothetical protein
MRKAKGNVRAFDVAVTYWQCCECGKWIASTDEHDRIVGLFGCEHIAASGVDLRWAIGHGIAVGSVQGQLWDGGP